MYISDVEHKLNVFISSKCGDRYTIARKTLKKLLVANLIAEKYHLE